MALRERISEILLKDWDPFGVQSEPLAQDEYEGYVNLIGDMLRNNATVDDLFNALDELESDMGLLVGSSERKRDTAQKLRSLL
jgi:hypothetical protein